MIIADTGLWVALFDRRDTHHKLARQRIGMLTEPLITTLPVITEACYLLQVRCGSEQPVAFLEAQGRGLVRIFEMDKSHLPRAAELMRRYTTLPMDFADASMVILAEHLGHGRILSTDRRDFGVYRWKNREPFTNLLLADA